MNPIRVRDANHVVALSFVPNKSEKVRSRRKSVEGDLSHRDVFEAIRTLRLRE